MFNKTSFPDWHLQECACQNKECDACNPKDVVNVSTQFIPDNAEPPF